MRKYMSLLLLVSLMCSCMTACVENEEIPEESVETGETESTVIMQETELKPDLPEMDFQGADFRQLVRTERMYYLETELTGDAFDDVVFERNRIVEDQYNIRLSYTDIQSDKGLFTTAVQSSVMSEAEGYDMIMPDHWWLLNIPEYMMNLRDMPYMDFEKPWWSKEWNTAADIGSGWYSCLGYYCLDLVRNIEVTYFNKSLITNHGLEDPYTLVKDGRWTMDKALEMGEVTAGDLNGDGKYTEDDAYAMYMNIHSIRGLYHSMGAELVVRDENGQLKMNGIDDNYLRINDYVYTLREKSDIALYRTDSTVDFTTTLAYIPFEQNNLLFTFFALTAVEAMRATEVDFGIIPCPKLDEADDYRSYCYGNCVFCFPLNTPDPERSSLILEALNYQSWKDTVPVYYEKVLKGKLARDNASEEMLDLIFSKITFNTGYAFNGLLGNPEEMHEGITENLVSHFAANREKYETGLADLIALFSK